MNELNDIQVTRTLQELHKKASGNSLTMAKGLSKGIFHKLQPEHMKDSYMAIGEEDGIRLYNIVKDTLRSRLLKLLEQTYSEFVALMTCNWLWT